MKTMDDYMEQATRIKLELELVRVKREFSECKEERDLLKRQCAALIENQKRRRRSRAGKPARRGTKLNPFEVGERVRIKSTGEEATVEMVSGEVGQIKYFVCGTWSCWLPSSRLEEINNRKER